MKEGKTEIVCVLDRSGSMSSIRQDAIGGFNTMIEGQRADLEDGEECNVSVYLFDNVYDTLYEGVDLLECDLLNDENFVPRGSTALLDAVGRTIDAVGARLAATDESERPENVVIAIITDGAENSSREYTYERVAEMIDHQTTKYSWDFMFLAANIDANAVASRLNIGAASTFSYEATAKGAANMYDTVGATFSRARRGGGAVIVDPTGKTDQGDTSGKN